MTNRTRAKITTSAEIINFPVRIITRYALQVEKAQLDHPVIQSLSNFHCSSVRSLAISMITCPSFPLASICWTTIVSNSYCQPANYIFTARYHIIPGFPADSRRNGHGRTDPATKSLRLHLLPDWILALPASKLLQSSPVSVIHPKLRPWSWDFGRNGSL